MMNALITPNTLNFSIDRAAKPQPRPVLNKNGVKARYPESFYPYYNFLRGVVRSVVYLSNYSTFNPNKCPVFVEIQFGLLDSPESYKFDLDNLVKPVLDALVSEGILKDDNVQHIQQLTANVTFNTQDNINVWVKVQNDKQ